MTERVYILLGSNLGEREKHLENAVSKLSELPDVQLVNCSGVYESPAVEMEDGSPDFLNQAVETLTELSPTELLSKLKKIEIKYGRTEKGMNKSRTIDLDILLIGNQVISTDVLTVPYRQLLNRSFAMIPLIEIAPDIFHPVLGEMVKEYVDDDDYNTVKLLYEYAVE